MNNNELIKRLSTELGEQVAPKKVLETAAAILRETLHSGKAVELLGLLRVQLLPQALTGELSGRSAINILPLPGLLPEKSAKIAPVKVRSYIAIVISEPDPFFKVMQKKLTTNHRDVTLVEGLSGLKTAMEKQKFDAVIVDGLVENLDEVRQWLKVAPENSLSSMIILYQEGQRPPLKSLTISEDVTLEEPYEDELLSKVVNTEIARCLQERKHFQHLLNFQIPADPAFQQVTAELLEELIRKSGLSDEGQMGLLVAFREAVDNAIRHGSKNVDKPMVKISYVLDQAKITVTIQDYGSGFDSSVYLTSKVSSDAVSTARLRHKEGRRGGLGIVLMLKSIDKLSYNREGTLATLTKYLKPPVKK